MDAAGGAGGRLDSLRVVSGSPPFSARKASPDIRGPETRVFSVDFFLPQIRRLGNGDTPLWFGGWLGSQLMGHGVLRCGGGGTAPTPT